MLGLLNILKGLSVSFKLLQSDNVDLNVELTGGMLMNSILLLMLGFAVGSGYCGMVFFT